MMRVAGWISLALGVCGGVICALPFVLVPLIALKLKYFPSDGVRDYGGASITLAPSYYLLLACSVVLLVVGVTALRASAARVIRRDWRRRTAQ